MSGATGGAVAAAIAAKKKRERMQKEEEVMTKYNSNDLDGWEFKIVRSATGAFNKLDKVQELCNEEARAGWEMIEKFDKGRIRFKRKTSMRSQDTMLEFDPYRTSYGMSEGGLASIIIGIVFVVVGAIVLILQYQKM